MKKHKKQWSFYLAMRLDDKDVGDDGVRCWTHVYKIFTSGSRRGDVEDLGRATDDNLDAIHNKYPNISISPLGGYAAML